MSDSQIVLISMDLEAGTSTFFRSDGKEAVFKIPSKRHSDSRVSRVEYSPQLRGVIITTTAGDQVALPLVTRLDSSHPAGNPVVYLDQNQWSAIARIRTGTVLPSEEDDRAAHDILKRVEDHRLVLPVSSGHCVESTEWSDGERRYQLGLTLMRLSAGWQVRHPLDVERDELLSSLHAFLGTEFVPSPVFSARPQHFTAERDRGTNRLDDDLADEYSQIFESLLHLSIMFDLLTHGKPIERHRAAAWREAQQAFSDHLDTFQGDKEKKRNLIRDFFVTGIGHSIADAAHRLDIPSDRLKEWLEGPLPLDLPSMPFLGLGFEFLVGKHMNGGVRWNDNDLIDMMYLCLAGAYADIVVCESSAASHIRQAQKRLGRPQTAVSKFPAAVALLKDSGPPHQL